MTPADQCNYCAAPIRWLITGTGKRMPVDAAPDPTNGNVAILGGKAAVLGPAKATAARAGGVELHLHHAVNCPHAKQWNGAAR
jgi:hypothetical protein